MAARTLWVGLDVGVDAIAVCGTNDQGVVVLEHSIPARAAAFHT